MAPGIGIASSQHATRLVHFRNYFLRMLEQVRLALTNNQIAPWWHQQFASTLGVPIRMGVRYQAGHLAIYEKNRKLEMQTFAALY
jgi:hypothetical protein